MSWPWRKRAERDLEDELQFHLDQAQAKAGSRRAAAAQFGGDEAIREECRAQRRGAALGDFTRDLRLGGRLLRRNPAFAAVAVLTLALAVGANTAAYSVLDAVLSLHASFPQPSRIVSLLHLSEHGQYMPQDPFWSGDFAEYRAQASAICADGRLGVLECQPGCPHRRRARAGDARHARVL
jgi:hypothetical protein